MIDPSLLTACSTIMFLHRETAFSTIKNGAGMLSSLRNARMFPIIPSILDFF
jgi:hypothetical protein